VSKRLKDLEFRAREELNKERNRLFMEKETKQSDFLKERIIEIEKAKEVLRRLEKQYQGLLEHDFDDFSEDGFQTDVTILQSRLLDPIDQWSVGYLFDEISKKISERG
jgi:hypothetical protein